jgi:hypothetical protein
MEKQVAASRPSDPEDAPLRLQPPSVEAGCGIVSSLS